MATNRLEVFSSRPVSQRLREAEEFFMKQGPVFSTLERLARRLQEENIPYAVVGGMALNLHNYERMTRDVDILMTREAIEKFIERCVGLGYVPAFPGARRHPGPPDRDSPAPANPPTARRPGTPRGPQFHSLGGAGEQHLNPCPERPQGHGGQ